MNTKVIYAMCLIILASGVLLGTVIRGYRDSIDPKHTEAVKASIPSQGIPKQIEGLGVAANDVSEQFGNVRLVARLLDSAGKPISIYYIIDETNKVGFYLIADIKGSNTLRR